MYDRMCAIQDYNRPSSSGMQTCDMLAHRQYELKKREKGQAINRL